MPFFLIGQQTYRARNSSF